MSLIGKAKKYKAANELEEDIHLEVERALETHGGVYVSRNSEDDSDIPAAAIFDHFIVRKVPL